MAEESPRGTAAEIPVTSNGDAEDGHDDVFQRVSPMGGAGGGRLLTELGVKIFVVLDQPVPSAPGSRPVLLPSGLVEIHPSRSLEFRPYCRLCYSTTIALSGLQVHFLLVMPVKGHWFRRLSSWTIGPRF